jgi:23S rRNA (pseudouridine1915-N3)-methyltransferase
MRVHLLCVGESRGTLREATLAFETRAGHYWRLEVQEVQAGLGKGKKSEAEKVRRAEEERLMAHLDRIGGEVIALTRLGRPMGSRELAKFLDQRAVRSVQDVSFVIGGAFGLGKGLLKRSTLELSLSSLTLPHEVARLVLVEQIYRAGTILRNEPYHKGS